RATSAPSSRPTTPSCAPASNPACASAGARPTSTRRTAMADVILRAPTPADIPALSLLGVAAFVHKFGDLYRPEDLLPFLRDTHGEAALARALADHQARYQVAERNGVLVGWARLALAAAFPEHARGARPM